MGTVALDFPSLGILGLKSKEANVTYDVGFFV
jgi:hypothetical protein